MDCVLLEGLSSYGHMVIWLCLDCMRKQMQIGMDMEYVPYENAVEVFKGPNPYRLCRAADLAGHNLLVGEQAGNINPKSTKLSFEQWQSAKK